jgi:uncharacterized protein
MIDRACISLNHKCNLRCKYCHFIGKENGVLNNAMEFSPSESAVIVGNIADYCEENELKKFKLGIVGSGEPLLSFEALTAVVKRAKQEDGLFRLYTITNGVTLTDEQIAFFYENRDVIELNFSLDGNGSVHNALRQSYHRTMNSICRYETFFREKPRINATVTRKTVEDMEGLARFFAEKGLFRINFSIVVDVTDPALVISQNEYEAFLDYFKNKGFVMRQKRNGIDRTYDCTMYGRLCGVRHTNIFITRAGIYPCSRFFGLPQYRLAGFDMPIADVEKNFCVLQQLDDSRCYYETIVRGQK